MTLFNTLINSENPAKSHPLPKIKLKEVLGNIKNIKRLGNGKLQDNCMTCLLFCFVLQDIFTMFSTRIIIDSAEEPYHFLQYISVPKEHCQNHTEL